MAQRCLVCAHPQKGLIEAGLRAGRTIGGLSREMGIPRQAIMRHRANHLVQLVDEQLEEQREEWQGVPESETPPLVPKDAFLQHYAATGDLRAAMREAHINRISLHKWLEHDEQFTLRYHQADAEAVENLEAEARIRAVAGSKMVRRVYRSGVLYEEIHEYRPSDAMLVKLLQAARPEKYGDKLTVTQTTVIKAIDAEAWNAV